MTKPSAEPFELRNIRFSEEMSEETHCFRANLYFKDKLVAYIRNDGQGGCTDVSLASPKVKPEYNALEAYAKLLPPLTLGEGMSIPMNLEHLADQLFEQWLTRKNNEKIIAKLNRETAKKIIILDKDKWEEFQQGKGSLTSYKQISFKHELNSYSPEKLRKSIRDIESRLLPGEFIYNDLSFLDNIYEPVANLDLKAEWKTLNGKIEKNFQHLKSIDQKAKEKKGDILYRYFDTPVADGRAYYQVVEIKGKKAKVYLCEGICPDNYADHILGAESWMDLGRVTAMIHGRDKLEKLFSKPKQHLS